MPPDCHSDSAAAAAATAATAAADQYVPVDLEARHIPLRLAISQSAISVYDVLDIDMENSLGSIQKSDHWNVPDDLIDALKKRNVTTLDLQREMDIAQYERLSWRNGFPMPVILTGEMSEVWLQGTVPVPMPRKGVLNPESWRYCSRALANAVLSADIRYAIPTGGLSLQIHLRTESILRARYCLQAIGGSETVPLLNIAVCLKIDNNADAVWSSTVAEATDAGAIPKTNTSFKRPVSLPWAVFWVSPEGARACPQSEAYVRELGQTTVLAFLDSVSTWRSRQA